LFHLILREIFRKPIGWVRQSEDGERLMDLLRLLGERIDDRLILTFQSFSVVLESGGSVGKR
jgi:hypothetical protein